MPATVRWGHKVRTMATRTKKKPAKKSGEVLARGVDRRPNAYRFRDRAAGGKTRHHINYEFLPEAVCRAAGLPNDDMRWPANALAQANEYSRIYWRDRDLPQAEEPALRGTLREWIERFRDEGLLGHLYGDPSSPAPFKPVDCSDAGRKHDVGQLDTLLRMGGFVIPGEAERRRDPRTAKMLDRNRPAMSAEVRDVLKTEVSRLGKSHLRVILERWAGGSAAPKTKRRLRTNLAAAMKYHENNYNTSAPDWLRVEIAGDGRAPKARALRADEWSAIKKRIDDMQMSDSVRACILFIRWTGVRKGEACRLRWEHLTWPQVAGAVPSARLVRTKARRGTYKERTVPLNDAAVDALRPMAGDSRKWPKSGWVFPAPAAPDEHVSGSTVYQAFIRVFGKGSTSAKDSRIGVARAAIHHLRHTNATEMSVHIGEQQMMELFGWSDASMLNVYRHQAEQLGLLVRDAHNQLHSTAELKNAEDVLSVFARLPEAERKRLMGDLAVAMHASGSTRTVAMKKPTKAAAKKRRA